MSNRGGCTAYPISIKLSLFVLILLENNDATDILLSKTEYFHGGIR